MFFNVLKLKTDDFYAIVRQRGEGRIFAPPGNDDRKINKGWVGDLSF
jgi:hypothetical protein